MGLTGDAPAWADFKTMQVDWQPEAAQWDAAHAAAMGSLHQDWAYGACLKLMGVRVLRAVVSQDGQPVALAQFSVRRMAGLFIQALCSRGPVWLAPLAPAEKAMVYRALRRSVGLGPLRILAVAPEDALGPTVGLPAWRRVMTGASTVTWDLQTTLEQRRAQLHPEWAAQLTTAEASGLTVHRVGTNPGQYRWLLDLGRDQRTERGLQALPVPFYDLYIAARKQPARSVLSLRADLGRDRVAGVMCLLHGDAATFQLSWVNPEGASRQALALLLWHAAQTLAAQGIRRFDLGGVDTREGAATALLKIGTGGTVQTFAGTYI